MRMSDWISDVCSSELRRRIVLEILDQGPRFGAFVEDLGFAFVDLAATGHGVQLSAGTKRMTPATGESGSGRRRGEGAPYSGKATARHPSLRRVREAETPPSFNSRHLDLSGEMGRGWCRERG